MIEEYMNILDAVRKQNSSNLTIGKMLEELKALPFQAKIKIDMSFAKDYSDYMLELFNDDPEYAEERAREFKDCQFYFSGTYYSYRGYYCDMAIGIKKKESEFTVKDMIELLNNAKNEGKMFGYKGGEYNINDNTLLWLEIGGNEASGIAPIKLYKLNDNEILLITKFVE